VAARHYEIIMEFDDKQNKVESPTAFKKQAHEAPASLNGCYVIETSHKELTVKEIWEYYMTLTQIEGAFNLAGSRL